MLSWASGIATMWRFTRNNGITEGRSHNKMETINGQAYGFRNFQNYRTRVKLLELEPPVRIELTTLSLRMRCSTN